MRFCLTLLLFSLPLLLVAQEAEVPAAAQETGAPAELDPLYQPSPFEQIDPAIEDRSEGFHWDKALLQSAFFLGVQHAFRFATEEGTRQELRGPFFKDYVLSVKGIRGWHDGDTAITNYVAHPFQGAVTGYIQIHNDPIYKYAEFGGSEFYWRSRLRAVAWATAYSFVFELGPASEASLGNVGKLEGTNGWVDFVMTPVGGFAMMITEDFLDRYVIAWVERKTTNVAIRMLVRGFLNPNRSMANMMRFEVPWRRDTRPGIYVPGR
jgi:hypothetical protein